MEKRLDWELDGVKTARELKVTGDDCGLLDWVQFVDRGGGVVPYG